jgi:mono/diheme cytochrome c family protein
MSIFRTGLLSGAVLSAATFTASVPIRAADSDPIFVEQGSDWKPTTRANFYTQDQGSRIMPLSWLEALKQSDGTPFLADSLSRYGYLRNPANSNGLPVGFTASGPQGNQFAGMTCAACHTRQISADGKEYRIDGGPAIVDFQTFLVDLRAAVRGILHDDTAFETFARAVLGVPAPKPGDVAELRENVQAWYNCFNALITKGLPEAPWGVGRLDAVGMIFNRLTGLDLGKPPSYLIADNIKRADAPVRYPFLWNARKQNKTQWPGFADNGNDLLGLSRNLGEVYGVFGVFEPKKEWWHLLGYNYLNNNSANFDGLGTLEGLVKRIGAPKWPWPIDEALAEKGKAIYNWPTAKGSCSECHGIRPGEVRFFDVQTWATTPLQDVGTDTRERRLDLAGADRCVAGRENPIHYRSLEGNRSGVQRARDVCSRLDYTELRSDRRNLAGNAGPKARAVPATAFYAGLEGRIPFAGPTDSKRQFERQDHAVCL